MKPRMTNHFKLAEAGFKPLYEVEAQLKHSPLDARLLHLVKLRASQINGCAYCIHLHTSEALKDNEQPMRLHLLPGWRDSSLYTDKERAALAWTEALTRIEQTRAPDEDWALVEAAFEPAERAWLSLAIGTINLWNRVQVGFRAWHPAAMQAAA